MNDQGDNTLGEKLDKHWLFCPSKNRSIQIGARLSPRLAAAFEAELSRRGCSKTDLVELALEQLLLGSSN